MIRKLTFALTVVLLLGACGDNKKPISNGNWGTTHDAVTDRYFRCYNTYYKIWCYEIDAYTATQGKP